MSGSAIDDRLGVAMAGESDGLNLALSGEAAVPEAVAAALQALDERARATGVRSVIVDVVALEFMNSSCFKRFVSWLSQIRDREEAELYKVAFRYDPKMYWQERSLHALRCFAVHIVSLEPVQAP